MSHARITIDGAGPYDEIAYREGSNTWEVLASHLSDTEAAAVFSALDGNEVGEAVDITESAVKALAGRRPAGFE